MKPSLITLMIITSIVQFYAADRLFSQEQGQQAGGNMEKLNGIKVAILVANGFEQSEMTEPRKALDEAGVKTFLISPTEGKVKAWKHGQWADSFAVDVPLKDARAEEYDALLLPGGVINPDTLRITPGAIEFIKKFVDAKKPIAAICHGPWTLINAEAVKGRKMTSWPSLSIDLKNAGALWEDSIVVVDGNLVTSRKPADIPQFNEQFLALLQSIKKA